MKQLLIPVIFFLHFVSSGQSIVDTKNYNSWWAYTSSNINISRNFIGLDLDSNIVDKNKFLQLLSTGKFLPAKTGLKNNIPCYKLYALDTAKKDIQSTIVQIANQELFYYNMEGKELPPYNFEDIKGNSYNNTNTKGKIIVLKCWFIHCIPCIKEFPELNKLVDDYKKRKDILFISLAFDTKQELTDFLKTKELNYAVVPDQQDFIVDKLGITAFPTHIIIDKKGKIIKAVNNSNDLIAALKKEVDN